ncbi:MAG: hypothetical protein G01um101416_640 [Microgenomates group bacterium Gr01-1014_16]|nr:MAG: hypothetical protein G01um101416_640 [Microgenomates group bacterium Gr01-1014_16]
MRLVEPEVAEPGTNESRTSSKIPVGGLSRSWGARPRATVNRPEEFAWETEVWVTMVAKEGEV